jgi:thymidine kinase
MARSAMPFDGRIHLVLGNMFSGKTTELLRQYKRFTLAHRKCLLIKHASDTRFDDVCITSHDGDRVHALAVQRLADVDQALVDAADVICIDEVQFFADCDVVCEAWANEGKVVVAAGLVATYQRQHWPNISRLIAKAETLTRLTAVCSECKAEGFFTHRTNASTDNLVGGSEDYESLCRKCWMDKN